MTSNACPYCGATPYSLAKKVELQTRCERCNGLIVASEEALNAPLKPTQDSTLDDQPATEDSNKGK